MTLGGEESAFHDSIHYGRGRGNQVSFRRRKGGLDGACCGFGGQRRGGGGGFGMEIGFNPRSGDDFELGFGFGGRGIGGLAGLLRIEASFGLFPFFLGLYEFGVGLVEGAIGGRLVANEDAEVFGDAKVLFVERLVEEGEALEAESAEG